MSGIVSDNQGRSSGLVKSTNVAEYDDDKVQSNIALLGFKTAVNGSLAKYNLQDQIIDEYEDATGIDAGASTNEELSSGVYKGMGTGFPVGGDSTDTSVTGYTTIVCGTSTSSGSILINNTADVDILVVAGGASGANTYGGGGGAGGLIYKAAHELTPNTYDWVVGAGGAALTSGSTNGNNGVDSTWTINGGAVEFTAKGGGGGGSDGGPGAGNVGGSAGGARAIGSLTGAVANQTSQSGDSGTYGFGNNGGNAVAAPNYNSGGGGGSGGAGGNASTGSSGAGGIGKDYSTIFGTAVGDSGWFASGGGGGYVSNGSGAGGTASAGGGSGGATTHPGASGAADANTGGGSGGSSSGGGDVGAGGSGIILIRSTDSSPITGSAEGGDLTLQSTDTTAMVEPDYADMVILMENNAGTATINVDIKGYISKDSGSTFTEGTLVDEGTWGTNKKIYAFHDLDISAQSGTSMCYKITTHNQDSSSKKTRIHATSIGWKA